VVIEKPAPMEAPAQEPEHGAVPAGEPAYAEG
jgi:hypothetical protein